MTTYTLPLAVAVVALAALVWFAVREWRLVRVREAMAAAPSPVLTCACGWQGHKPKRHTYGKVFGDQLWEAHTVTLCPECFATLHRWPAA